MRRVEHFCLFITSLLMLSLTVVVLGSAPMSRNLSGQQAIAFLQGRLDIPDTPENRAADAAVFSGKTYSPFPPLPAILMLPFMLIFGFDASMNLLLLPTFGITAWYFWKLLKQADEIRFPKIWLLFAFLFASPVWTTLVYGYGVWYSAQLIGMMFVVIALWASLSTHPRRSLYTGIALAGAFLCRQLTILLIPVFIAILWETIPSTQKPKLRQYLSQLVSFSVPVLIAGGLYLAFNYLRFGNPLDTGYSYIRPDNVFDVRLHSYGLYSPRYFAFNTLYFLFQGFHIQFGGIDNLQIQGVDLYGSAILVASPFLVAAFYAQRSFLVSFIAWLSITMMIVGQLFYHNNGFVQVNNHRFSMDYLPVLMFFAALGVRRFPISFVKGTIIWGVILNVLAVLVALFTYGVPK